MEEDNIVERVFQLIIEGNTKSEIRAKIGMDRPQYAKLLESPKLRKLFDVPVTSATGLIGEMEQELFDCLRIYHSLKDKKGIKAVEERRLMSQRIENLSVRYTNFILPVKHKRDENNH